MRRVEGSVDYAASGNNVYQDVNEHLREGLSSKVTALKSLTIDIGREVKHHNRLLEEMDTDFDSAGGLLGTAMGKVKHLARHSPSVHLFYMALFSLAVFFVLYWFIKL